jgi:hypothetical protein
VVEADDRAEAAGAPMNEAARVFARAAGDRRDQSARSDDYGIMQRLARVLLVSSLFACDLGLSTNTPESPQESEQQQRNREIVERERSKYLKELEEARGEFEADASAENYKSYVNAVLKIGGRPPPMTEGIDIAAHEERLLSGSGKALLDRLQADYAKKKQRPAELREGLKMVHAYRFQLLYRRRPDVDFKDDGIAALAIGYPDDDWRIGDGTWVTDVDFLDALADKRGRPAVHQACRAALDRVVADDRRDKTRQSYVLEACALDDGDWEADLAAWASAKETKEFRKAFAPIHADDVAQYEANRAERQGKQRANARGSSGSDKPLVMLINSCERRIELAIGDDPDSAGSRRLSLMADQSTHEKIKADTRVWLVGAKNKVITHATVSRYTSELEFTCTGVAYR